MLQAPGDVYKSNSNRREVVSDNMCLIKREAQETNISQEQQQPISNIKFVSNYSGSFRNSGIQKYEPVGNQIATAQQLQRNNKTKNFFKLERGMAELNEAINGVGTSYTGIVNRTEATTAHSNTDFRHYDKISPNLNRRGQTTNIFNAFESNYTAHTKNDLLQFSQYVNEFVNAEKSKKLLEQNSNQYVRNSELSHNKSNEIKGLLQSIVGTDQLERNMSLMNSVTNELSNLSEK